MEKIQLKTFEEFITEKPGGLNPPDSIYKNLEELIDKLLVKHKGGKPFFDALDDQIKNVLNKKMIIALLKPFENEYIASSGGFGDTLMKLYKKKAFKCKGFVTFNGKMLTLGKGVESYKPEDFDVKKKSFVFVDDSYFSGGTARKIESFFIANGSKVKSVAVIYDGSKTKRKVVNSFYRYYE